MTLPHICDIMEKKANKKKDTTYDVNILPVDNPQ